MSRCTTLLIAWIGLLVGSQPNSCQADLLSLFGGSRGGSSGGSSGTIAWGSSGGSSGGFGSVGSLFHSHGFSSSGGSSGGSSGSSGGSRGGMMIHHAPMVDAYAVPMGPYQGYVPLSSSEAGFGMMPMSPMSPAESPSVGYDLVSDQESTVTDGIKGTVGLTYQRRSKRVNWDKHPRIGLLEVTVSEDTFRRLADGEEVKITVEDDAGHFEEIDGFFGEDDKWHFESKPLYPGIPHIYNVTFEIVRAETKRERKGDRWIQWEVEKKVRDLGVRRVRLIPGREVFLNFP